MSLKSLTAKTKLESAGLSRATKQMTEYAFVTISAFRKYKLEAYTDKTLLKQGLAEAKHKNKWLNENKELSKKYLKTYKENMIEHRRLMLAVRRYDIFCYQIIGQYPEGGESKKEVSLFCFAPKEKAKKFRDIMIKLGNFFEQDSICFCAGADIERAIDKDGFLVESKLKADIVEIATSPKEINAKGLPVGAISATFKGVAVGSLATGEIDDKGVEILQDIFSKIKNRPFYYTGYKEVETPHPVKVKGYHSVGNIYRVSASKDIEGSGAYCTGDYDWVLAWIRGEIDLQPAYTLSGTKRWRHKPAFEQLL